MKVEIAFEINKARKFSFQDDFPKVTKCKCGGESRLGFVAHETEEPKGARYVCHLYENKGGMGDDYWLHDACAVAVYFCKKCLQPTALFNQA